MKCECEASGLCARRGCEIPEIHWRKCKAGQVATIDKVYHFSPDRPTRRGMSINALTRQKIGVGTALKTKIADLLAIKAGGTCGCNTLAKMMDGWGPVECEARREYIVDRLMENKRMIADSLQVVDPTILQSFVASVVSWSIGLKLADPALRAGAHWMLTEAIKETEAKQAEAPKPEPRTVHSRVRHKIRPNLSPGKPERGPAIEPIDTTGLLRNFQMHIWPSQNGAWRWNCDQVMQRAALFNGRRIVAIAVDSNSCSSDEVKEYLKGFTDDFIVIKNEPHRREVASWLPLLERQHTLNPNEVTFSCHSKISRHNVTPDNDGSTLYRWASAMYESCLDHWELVSEHLATKAMTGSFKRYGMFRTPNNHCWHYSGTFYWFRNRDVFSRNWGVVDQHFFGTESYPGLLFHPDDTGCLFGDQIGDLYKLSYWDSEIQPQLESWRNARSLQAT